MIHTYKKLIVWKKALDTVIEIYTLTEKFPNSEIYALSS
ncbi:MAG: four helix bundle protein [Candidatus Pacebacteria bacterium]|nr:four helix bundle protein [Candidatus Paceibacterota bacterium]